VFAQCAAGRLLPALAAFDLIQLVDHQFIQQLYPKSQPMPDFRRQRVIFSPGNEPIQIEIN
jgi:hypothetical protein